MGAHTKYQLRQDFRKENITTAITILCLLHVHHVMTGMKAVIGTILIIPTAFSRIISIIFHSKTATSKSEAMTAMVSQCLTGARPALVTSMPSI